LMKERKGKKGSWLDVLPRAGWSRKRRENGVSDGGKKKKKRTREKAFVARPSSGRGTVELRVGEGRVSSIKEKEGKGPNQSLGSPILRGSNRPGGKEATSWGRGKRRRVPTVKHKKKKKKKRGGKPPVRGEKKKGEKRKGVAQLEGGEKKGRPDRALNNFPSLGGGRKGGGKGGFCPKEGEKVISA